jgi:hypothetical protein
MKTMFARVVCRVLAASIVALPLQAQAGMVGTGEAVSAAQAQAARARVTTFVNRAEVAAQLQAMGLSPQAAQERIAALTDAEIASLADRVERLPAGGLPGQAFGLIIIVIFLIWRFVFSDQAKAEMAKPGAKPATKPAAKPEPEKK